MPCLSVMREIGAFCYTGGDAVGVALADSGYVLGDLACDFGVEVDAVHLGEGHEIDGDVGQFFTEVGQVFAPCGEGFADLSGEQSELEWHVGGVEPFGDLVVPGALLSVPDYRS